MAGESIDCGSFHLDGTWLAGAYEHQSDKGAFFRYEEVDASSGRATVKHSGSTLENEHVTGREAAGAVFAKHADLW